MIIYDKSYRNVFREVSEDAGVLNVLNCIKAISISVTGTPSSDITSCGAPSAVLTHVTSGDAGVAFTIDITVPALWGDTHEIIEVHNHSYEDHTKGLRIIVDHDITGDCNINTYAELLLRSFIINLQRRITFNTGTSVSSGYNVSVAFKRKVLHITGGAGLGIGRYKGSVNETTNSYYRGIKSINGLRAARNVDISVSDLLAANGANVQNETSKSS